MRSTMNTSAQAGTTPQNAPHTLDRYQPHVLGLFRIVVGLLFACHGAATLFDILGGPKSGSVPDVGQWPSWWAAVIQLVGGVLVLAGLGTRIAALICSGSMAYAYFVSHQGDGLFPIQNGGVPSALYCWSFFLIVIFGPGSWAAERLFGRTSARAG